MTVNGIYKKVLELNIETYVHLFCVFLSNMALKEKEQLAGLVLLLFGICQANEEHSEKEKKTANGMGLIII